MYITAVLFLIFAKTLHEQCQNAKRNEKAVPSEVNVIEHFWLFVSTLGYGTGLSKFLLLHSHEEYLIAIVAHGGGARGAP